MKAKLPAMRWRPLDIFNVVDADVIEDPFVFLHNIVDVQLPKRRREAPLWGMVHLIGQYNGDVAILDDAKLAVVVMDEKNYFCW